MHVQIISRKEVKKIIVLVAIIFILLMLYLFAMWMFKIPGCEYYNGVEVC